MSWANLRIWDKQDASGLVWYTDAAYWDRMAGDLDERCADAWDVEESDAEVSPTGSTMPSTSKLSKLTQPPLQGSSGSAMEQGTGLAAVRQGAAGRIMRLWGSHPTATPSSTLLAVVEGLQPNMARTGLGWSGDRRERQVRKGPVAPDEWNRIGSIYDCDSEKKRSFSVRPTVPGSFSAASLYFAEDRLRKGPTFVAASTVPSEQQRKKPSGKWTSENADKTP